MRPNNFVLYADSLEILDLMSNDQIAQLFLTIRDYVLGRDIPELDQVTSIAFLPIKNQLDRDAKKYEAKCLVNAQNGKKGGRPPKGTGKDGNRENPVGFEETQPIQTEAKKPQSQSQSQEQSQSNNNPNNLCIGDKSPKKRASRFTPPSVEEVRAYCFERGNNVDPERFVDFYESKGWTVGKNRMRDWKAAVRNWERTNNDSRPKDIVSQRLEALRNFGGDENDLFN